MLRDMKHHYTVKCCSWALKSDFVLFASSCVYSCKTKPNQVINATYTINMSICGLFKVWKCVFKKNKKQYVSAFLKN